MTNNDQKNISQQYQEHRSNKQDSFRKEYKTLPISDIVKNLIKHANHNVPYNKFFQKLLMHWQDIVSDKRIARYSIPGKIINDNNKLMLQIYAYNGPAGTALQSSILQIKQNIKLYIGYFPVNDIRIIQKSSSDI